MVKSEKTYKTKWHYRFYKVIFWTGINVTLVMFVFSTILCIKGLFQSEIIFTKPDTQNSYLLQYFDSKYDTKGNISIEKTLGMPLFLEEKIAYQKMKADNLDNNEAKELIQSRRSDKLKEYGLENKKISFESEGIVAMMNKGIGIDQALKSLNNVVFSENFMQVIFFNLMYIYCTMGIVGDLLIWGLYRAFVYVKYDE